MESESDAPGWRIGGILAGITLLALLADGILRLFPIAPFCFRAWEAARHERPRRAAFTPGFRFERDRCFGDLSNMGNLPWIREYHSVKFTVDSLGFRNPSVPPKGSPPAALLVGSSYSGGAGLLDEDTLSSRLGDLLGAQVYNTAAVPLELEEIRDLARQLGMESGWIIYEHTSRNPPPVRPAPGAPQWKRRPSRDGTWARLGRRWQTSRLEILCARLYRLIQDDTWLPNVHRRNVICRTLVDGRTMLFLPSAERKPYEDEEIRQGAAYWKWMAEELARDNLRLALFLVPDKHLVYGPLLREGAGAFDAEARSLEILEKEIAAAGVPVCNPLKELRLKAAEELGKGATLYAIDDTHWKASGVRVVAGEVLRLLGK
jgi:hypothetical protein